MRGSVLGAYVPIHHAKFLRKHKKQNLSCKICEGILKHSLKSVTGEGSLLNFVRKLSSDSLKASLN